MAPVRYQLTIHAQKLSRGWFRKPNPYAEVTITGGPREGTNLGRTEVLEKAANPEWVKTLFFDTESSEYLPLKIVVYDDRGIGYDDVLIAEASFEATEVHRNAGHADSAKYGWATIHVSVEESNKGDARGEIHFQIRGLDIRNVEPGILGLGRSDPFFELARKNADHTTGFVSWNVVYRSEQIHDHLNPYWASTTFTLEELCYGDLGCPLKITVFDHENNGKHRIIGSFETTVQELTERVSIRGNADRVRAFKIFKENESAQKSIDETKNRGLIVVLKAAVTVDHE